MIFLIAGMKHCGKSTYGKALAQHLNCPFYDTDELIERDYYETTGENISCRDFFKKFGADRFQNEEVKIFKNLRSRISKSGSHNVISLGGRLACNFDLEEDLKNFGIFVYIKTEPQILFERVKRNGLPPFLSEESPYRDFLRLCEEREPYYEKYSDLTIEVGDEPIEQAIKVVINSVEEYINGR